MAAHGPIISNDPHFGLPGQPKVVVGFQAQGSAAQTDGNTGLVPARSLLSELLLRDDASAHYEMASVSSQMDQSDDEEMDCDEFDEQWEWLSNQRTEQQQSSSATVECDRSSQSSCPIPIPSLKSSACYFKDEMQRAALNKLNEKRKWYQQQLEAERMMARSMAKSKQGAAASRANKPAGRPGAPA